MRKFNSLAFLAICTIHLIILVDCNWTRCSYLAKTGIVDCVGQHFDKIAQTVRLNAPRSEFYPSTIGGQVRLLNLSMNAFKSINSSSFSSLKHPETLEVLDISHNKLMFISPGAFKTLSNLKVLLLNDNQLHALDRLSFVELESLEELNLDSNPLSSFPDGTFASLGKLRRISIMSNQLSCDCQIADLLRFVKNEQIQVSSRTICIFPYSLRGMQVAKLNVKTLKRSCGKGGFNPTVFDLEPASRSVIVYPGDEKNITCKVSKSNGIQMEWLKNNVPLADSSRLFTMRYNDSKFLYLKLCLNPVIWEDEGDWTCYVEQDRSVLKNTIRITPVLVNTVHCVQEWQADEKGEIIWVVSQQGLVTAKCPNGPANAKAYRKCKRGKWDIPDTSQCAYTSPLIMHFLTLLQHKRTSLYVDELLRTKRRPFEMSAYETRLAGWLIGNATGLSSRQMLAALNFVLQSEFARTELNGKLMRQWLQQLLLGDQIIQEDNLAICQHLFAKDYDATEPGIMKGGFLALHDGSKFSCREQQFVELLPKTGGASLRIPRPTIDQFPSLVIVRVLWLSNSKIFKNRHTSDGRWTVVGEVYGVAIKHISLKSSESGSIPEQMAEIGKNDDFYGFLISYRINKTVDQIQLGVWDDEEGWKLTKETNCLLRRVGPNNILFTCSRMFFIRNVNENIKYFAAMQNTPCEELIISTRKSAKLTWYICASSGFLASVMILTIIINVCLFCASNYCSRRNQQIIVNMCACIFVLCALYSLVHNGIHDSETCRAVAVAQYFFFLAVYFWLMQAFRLLQEDLSKFLRNYSQNKDDKKIHTEAEKVTLNGTLTEMYFVSYGIPLIVMSTVLAADNLSHDGSPKLCFPSSTMHIKIFAYAIYAPLFICAILILGIVVTILRLLITARHLTIERIPQQYVEDKSCEENSTHTGSKTASAELSKRASAATTQLLFLVSINSYFRWLLVIAVLYSLDCYAAATHLNQFNDSGLSATSNSYFNALFNILLALAIFYPFTLESICTILLKTRDSGCSAYVTKSFVSAPYIYKERIVPLLQRESAAGYSAEGEWV
uniref:Ig-like domain-containing protein n=1 Tax=Onchocerca volvulus TaxID=6282 RepID=A0A8R1XVK9_ONCVO